MPSYAPFEGVWAVDTEYTESPGDRPVPIVVVARNLVTGERVRVWLADGPVPSSPPFPTDTRNLFVAYAADAELGCFLELGWEFPARILDLHAEFRWLRSGLPGGRGLIAALQYFGLPSIAAEEKTYWRDICIRGGPFNEEERAGITDYCESDVIALELLLPKMWLLIDLPRAVLRGRYMEAVTTIKAAGIPIDVEMLTAIQTHWDWLRHRLLATVGADHLGLFVPTGQRPIAPYIEEYAKREGVPARDLADAVETVFAEERDSLAQIHEERRKARKILGLTHRQLNLWEDRGFDSASWPDISQRSREIARVCPNLGLGLGYDSSTGEDKTDYEGQVWAALRERDEKIKPRHHPDILRRAVEMVSSRSCREGYFGPLTFSRAEFRKYLIRHGIPWPLTETGQLDLDDDNVVKEMARIYPREIGPVRALRQIHGGELKRIGLTVGADGRNRASLMPFTSSTGRNQPSNAKYIFGPATWVRSLIKPGPGRAVAYIDWSAQELAIAAYLSGDKAMKAAYESGDPYLWWAKKVGAVPQDVTKEMCKEVEKYKKARKQYKEASLGVLFGLTEVGLSRKLDISRFVGREMLAKHRETFPDFWKWTEKIGNHAMLTNVLTAVFGWRTNVPRGWDEKWNRPIANIRSLRNFHCQANGAEMMRLGCIYVTEAGIQVIAVVHDAIMIESSIEDIDADTTRTQELMKLASVKVLPGFPVRTEPHIVRYPDRYMDDRGEVIWPQIEKLLKEAPERTAEGLFGEGCAALASFNRSVTGVLAPPRLRSGGGTAAFSAERDACNRLLVNHGRPGTGRPQTLG
jgi:hypothetical protein